MGQQYTGDPSLWAESYEIPDDGDRLDAASVNIAHEALGDRTAYLKHFADTSKCVPVTVTFLASGTFQVPANALAMGEFEGCGGGGCGGVGGYGVNAGLINAGGGGGGGAVLNTGRCILVPGETYEVVIGSGGLGADSLFGVGFSGGDTKLVKTSDAFVVVTCRGAGGGHFGGLFGSYAIVKNQPIPQYEAGPAIVNQYVFARGGSPVRPFIGSGVVVEPTCSPAIYSGIYYNNTPHAGGLGVSSNWPSGSAGGQGSFGCNGLSSPQGFEGGTFGAQGTHNSDALDRFGGGSGGGGGAGPYGKGGNGGAGSHATGAVSVAVDGGDGEAAAANTGAGGGGGGGAGSGKTPFSNGGSPGPGGSGQFRLTYFVPLTG